MNQANFNGIKAPATDRDTRLAQSTHLNAFKLLWALKKI